MNHMLIPPFNPKQSEPVRPHMVYVEKRLKWEYKQIIRNMEKETPPDEAELDKLGAGGWEMSGIAEQSGKMYFYFKRQVEKQTL